MSRSRALELLPHRPYGARIRSGRDRDLTIATERHQGSFRHHLKPGHCHAKSADAVKSSTSMRRMPCCVLGARLPPPDAEGLRPDRAAGCSGQFVSARMEVAVNEGMSGEEGLRLLRRFEALHLSFSPPCRVEITACRCSAGWGIGMRWILRLIATGDDAHCRSTDLAEICRPEGLSDIPELGLTLRGTCERTLRPTVRAVREYVLEWPSYRSHRGRPVRRCPWDGTPACRVAVIPCSEGTSRVAGPPAARPFHSS